MAAVDRVTGRKTCSATRSFAAGTVNLEEALIDGGGEFLGEQIAIRDREGNVMAWQKVADVAQCEGSDWANY
jgi:hypothetical protein